MINSALFSGSSALLQIVLRTTVIYLLVLIGVRLSGKREVGQMMPFDLTLLLLLSNSLQNSADLSRRNNGLAVARFSICVVLQRVIFMGTRIVAVVLLTAATASVAFPSQPSFPFGLIRASGAPWDGPAIDLRLTTELAECKKTGEPYIDIGVWRGLPIHAGQRVSFGQGSDAGFASRCARDGNCQRAESGWVEFESYKEGAGARGRYELHFKDGESLKASFEAKWCEERVVCG